MGDVFHSTSANQTAQNQQIGVQTRDVGGAFTVGGAGSTTLGPGSLLATNGSSVKITSLDPAALQVAADALHDAVTSSTATSLAAIQGYQSALNVSGQEVGQALSVAQSGAGQGVLAGLNPSQIIWIAGGLVALVIIVGIIRK